MAKTLFRRITKKFVITANIVAVIIFLLSCLAPYLNPTRWWPITFLGMGFPIILLVILAFGIFWLFIKPRIALISFVALLISWKSLTAFFAFHFFTDFKMAKEENALRIMQWNVMRFGEMNKPKEEGRRHRDQMLEVVKKYDADILCFQEFFHADNPRYSHNLTDIRDQLGYPYTYFTRFADCYTCFYGLCIFSRYPIVDSAFIQYPGRNASEDLIYVDIKKGADTFRIFTTHLQSVQFNRRDYRGIEKIKNTEDSLVEASRGILSKIKRGFVYRSKQADLLRELADKSPHPAIIAGDFNDVPTTYTYNRIRGNRRDVFQEKGAGIGRTYTAISPTLRIDFVFTDTYFDVLQYHRDNTRLSDHYPIITDIRPGKKN